MGKKNSRGFLIKVSDGEASPTFVPFTSLTAKSMGIGNERVDVTTEGIDPNAAIWAESIDGTKTVSVSGDYTAVDDDAEARLIEITMQQDPTEDLQIVIPNVGTFDGNFAVTKLDFSGDGAVKGSFALDSNGPVAFAAAT